MNEQILAKWLRWAVYISALIPLVIFSQFISPFHFGKVIVFRALVEIMAVAYILLVWRQPEYRPKGNPFTWAFLAFTLVFTLTAFTSSAFSQSWWGTLERMGGLFTFWHYFVFYIIAISVLRTREHWQTLLDLIVSVGVISAIYGFLQKTDWSFILGSGNRTRPFGTIGNAALFAGYEILVAWLALTSLFFTRHGPVTVVSHPSTRVGFKLVGVGLLAVFVIALAFSAQGLWVIPFGVVVYGTYLICVGVGYARIFYIIAACISFLAAIMTGVRGSLLAIAVSTVVFVLLWSALYRSRRARNALIGLLGAGVAFVFLAVMLRDTAFVKNSGYLTRITDFSSQTYTVQTRFWTWESGLQGWLETPKSIVFGWGPENFNVPFSHFFNPLHFQGPGAETFFDRAHNNFVEVLVTMGIVGLASYLALFAVLFWTFAKLIRKGGDERVLGIGFTAMVIAYMIHNSFIFDTSANYITFFMLMGFAIAMHQGIASPLTDKIHAPRWRGGHTAVGGLLTIGALILIWTTAVMPTRANYATTRAIVAGWEGDFYKSIDKYREAIAYNTPGRYEFRHKFAQYILDVSTASNIGQIKDFPNIAHEAIVAVEVNVRENPPDYLPLLYLARLHIILGKDDPASEHNDIAIDYVRKALDISPTFVRTYYEMAQAYLNKEEPDMALEWFTKAKDLQPAVGITWWYMAVSRGQLAEEENDLAGTTEAIGYAETALEKGFTISEANAQMLAVMYLRVGTPERIVPLFELGVQQNPTNATMRARLGVAYANVGRYSEAIETLQFAKTLSTDAKFRTEVDDVLKQLGVTP
ncbi:MAG TPA: O-antigen ligase family protein [Candidatus Paceibacterota bacterium]|nr:O-antigen ligase family protein [Candidatus Paceibacterota bacterium]